MNTRIPALIFNQNDTAVILFSISAGDLKEISYFNTRDIDREDGLQREFKSARSKAIADFLQTDSARLVNNIILNLELEKNGLKIQDIFDGETLDIEYLKSIVRNNQLKSEHQKIAFVVDGQHRLRAFEQIDMDEFPIPVSALVDLSLAESAELFVQINYNQKPVNKSHVFDLLGISENIFPKYYLLHKAVELLQEDSASPFYNKIKMLGVGKGYISQASLITALEKYKIVPLLKTELDDCDEHDIYNVMWHFFDAVEESFPDHWGDKKILSKTVGIRALVRLLHLLLKRCIEEDDLFNSDYVNGYFKKIRPNFFNEEKFQTYIGEKGVNLLYNDLAEELELQ